MKIQIPKYPILIYDGNCGLCHFAVQFILKHERNELIRFTPFQSEFAKDLLAHFKLNEEANNTVIFIEEGKAFIKSKAVVQLSKYLTPFYSLFYFLKYIPFADFFYDMVAKNRYALFKKAKSSCLIPKSNYQNRFLN